MLVHLKLSQASASRSRPPQSGLRSAHDFKERTYWFFSNIVTTRPKTQARCKSRAIPKCLHKRSRSSVEQLTVAETGVCEKAEFADTLQDGETVTQAQHALLPRPPKLLRRSKIPQGDDTESEPEDFGQLCSVTIDDSSIHQYHSVASLSSAVNEPSPSSSLPTVGEDSGVDLRSSCQEYEGLLDATGSRTSQDPGSCTTGVRISSSSEPHTPRRGSAATPSIVLTLPTPCISQSPIFQPRSPITLAKYVRATTTGQCTTPTSSGVGSLSPVPSVPSCDRCCLAQLEEGYICRACERQWLACQMWYRANDGGRRRWLTEPFIRPAESNANLRAVMGGLGVPGSTGTAGLGLQEPSTKKSRKELPFKVIPTIAHVHPPRAKDDFGAKQWRHIRRTSLYAVRKISVVLSASLELLSVYPPGGMDPILLSTSHDSLATSCTAHIVPHTSPHVTQDAPPHGSTVSRLACVSSSSRFVEHLV